MPKQSLHRQRADIRHGWCPNTVRSLQLLQSRQSAGYAPSGTIWGVLPVLGTPAETTDEMFDIAVQGGINSGLVKLGDTVIITAGVPVGFR